MEERPKSHMRRKTGSVEPDTAGCVARAAILISRVQWAAVVPVLLVVLGWLVTHMLTLDAQRKQFRIEVEDRARSDITSAIRDSQEWLTTVESFFVGMELTKSVSHAGTSMDWNVRLRDLAIAIEQFRRCIAWAMRIEEYQIVFPSCEIARVAIQDQLLALHQDLLKLYALLASAAIQGRDPSSEVSFQLWVDRIMDLQGLFEDLRIYLQNQSLSKTFGRKIPERALAKPGLPRLALNEDGELTVVSVGSAGG